MMVGRQSANIEEIAALPDVSQQAVPRSQ